MEVSDLYLLGFLLIFHIYGSIALANALRGLWNAAQGRQEPIFGHLFFLFFGALIGCSPLYYGLRYALSLWFLTVQLMVVFGVLVFTFFVSKEFQYALGRDIRYVFRYVSRSLFTLNAGLVVLGGLFVIAGLMSAVLVMGEPNGLILAFLFGGIFGVIGASIMLLGIIRR